MIEMSLSLNLYLLSVKFGQLLLRLTQQDDVAIIQTAFRTPERAHRVAPHVHRVFSNLKAWLNGTHHGVNPGISSAIGTSLTFDFNRRNTPMPAFQTLLGITPIRTKPSRTW